MFGFTVDGLAERFCFDASRGPSRAVQSGDTDHAQTDGHGGRIGVRVEVARIDVEVGDGNLQERLHLRHGARRQDVLADALNGPAP